jgi:ABC-type multidrug transport system fused ATPase/permease subunit
MLISNLLMALVISLILFYNYFNILVVVGLLLFSISFIQYRILKNRQLSLGKEYADLSNRRSQILYQTFCNLKENKIFHTENFFYKKFTDVNNKFVRNETIRLFYSMLPSYFTEMMLIVSIVVFSATIITGHIDNVANIMSSLAILAGIAFRMAPIINRVLVSLGNINSTKDFVEVLVKEFKRFDEMKFINLEDRKKIIPLSFKHNIIFENISFNYPNKIQPALSNINLEIKKGDFIGIVGKSGAGKTTFVDILLGLLTPTTGNLKVDDVLILEENSANWQANLSYIPQHIYINDDTIERNVAFGLEDKHINRDKVIEALKNADIYDFIIENLPQGIETIVGDQGKKLSGGQKQRIGIARALYHASDLIVLDEATAALDVNTENNITQAINKLKKDKTIIAIAHRLSTLKQADYLLFFDKGRLVDKGNFEYLSKYSEFQRFIKLSKIEQNNE